MLIEADLHSVYGVDVATGILRRRTGTWLTNKIVGLLGADTRLSRELQREHEEGS